MRISDWVRRVLFRSYRGREGARLGQKGNAATDKLIPPRPGLDAYLKRSRSILDDDRQIAMPGEVMGETITNFWRDAANPRGIWRQSPLDAYLAGKPVWTTLIDVDALGKAEKQSWVWHGADCLAPDYQRCLVSLSPGGTDRSEEHTSELPSLMRISYAVHCLKNKT